MKIRTGFVSNSSSSSFIVATKGDTPLVAELRIEVNLKPMIHSSISTIEELEEYIKDEHGYEYENLKQLLENDDYVRRIYDKAKPLVENGYTIHLGSASDEEDAEEAFICDQGLEGNIVEDNNMIVVYSEAGY